MLDRRPHAITLRYQRPLVRWACALAVLQLMAACNQDSAPISGGYTNTPPATVPPNVPASAAGASAAAGVSGAATPPTLPIRDGAGAPSPTGDTDSGVPDGVAPKPAKQDAELAAQGCDPTRPAITYRGSTGAHSVPEAAPAGTRAPIPCVKYPGYGSSEPSLVIDSKGTVYYAPVFTDGGSGLVKSSDQGVTWTKSIPTLANDGHHGRVQPYLYRDPKTDRLFYASMASAGINSPASMGLNLSVSTDGATGWQYYANITPAAIDWVKIFAGPPVTSKTSEGYPNVIYASAPAPISTPVPVAALIGVTPQYQQVQKSLDGGKTWKDVSKPSLLPADVPNCKATEWVIMGNGIVGPDGTAYQVFRRCERLAINKSSDEGVTWSVIEIPGGTLAPFDTTNLLEIVADPNIMVTEALTQDSAGNLYIAWIDRDGLLRLTYSKDKATTWSKPVTISAPDVTEVRYAGVDVKEPGTFAVAYYGSKDGFAYHGYVAETFNAFDPEPSFWSVTVNSPSRPLHTEGFEVGYLGILNGADLNEIVHVKYAPNGDLWASFIEDHCKGVLTTSCGDWDVKAHANSPYEAVVGHVVHGVAPAFAAAAPYVPPTSTCENSDSAPQNECRATAESEMICSALTSCFCDHCGCQFTLCDQYPDCRAVRQCALKNNCRGLDCIFACGDVAYGAGEWMTTLALEVAKCGTANSCPTACPLF